MDHNGQQFRLYIWKTAMLIISLLILMNDRGDPKHSTHRLQSSCLEAESVHVIHTSVRVTHAHTPMAEAETRYKGEGHD